MKVFNRPGLTIAVLGVDGAGKSTVIQALVPRLKAMDYGVEYKHLRPGWLLPLSRLKPGGRGDAKESDTITNPHGSPPSGTLGSLFRLIYLLLDYTLGYQFTVLPRLRRERMVLLYDRYGYDLRVDPRRFRIKLPDGVLASLIRWIPRPDAVICLHAPAEAIHARKAELSVEEINRQINLMRQTTDGVVGCSWVSTEGPVDAAVEQVLYAVREAAERLGHVVQT